MRLISRRQIKNIGIEYFLLLVYYYTMLTKEDLNAIESIMEKKIKPVRQQIKKVQKDMDVITRVFDSEIVDLEKRTTKLEQTVFATI
jgi:hypothetical protein